MSNQSIVELHTILLTALLAASPGQSSAQDTLRSAPKLGMLTLLFDSLDNRGEVVFARVRQVFNQDGLVEASVTGHGLLNAWDYQGAPTTYTAMVTPALPHGLAVSLAVTLAVGDTVRNTFISRLLTSRDRAEWGRLERPATAIKGAALRCDTVALPSSLVCR